MILSVPKHFVSTTAMHGTYARHSAFDHTMNFIRDDTLVSLHDKDRTLSPLGIRLNVDTARFETLRKTIDTVKISASGILINGQEILYQDVFLIDHDLIKQINTKGSITNPMRHKLYREMEGAIARHADQQDILSRRTLDDRIESLRRAFEKEPLDDRTLHEKIKALIGLGPGLTPSGDDILAGLLAGLIMQGRKQTFEQTAPLVREGVLHPNQTSIVSRQFLLYATQGIFIGEILMLHHRLLLSRAIDQIIDKIASMGHSSGIDYLKGLMLAISIGGINHDS